MPLTNTALWIIERNLNRDLSLGELAKRCGVSRFHLSHAFGEATGRSVMDYVRGRRLSEAARALAAGAGDILAVALDTGYGSHEAFTRAFRAQFGQTPDEVRRSGTLDGLALVAPLPFAMDSKFALKEPRFEKADKVLFVGLGAPLDYGKTSHIPAQWQRFMSEFHWRIENKTGAIPLGISTLDDEGHLTYVCAAEVSRFGDVPSELTRLTIAPATYAVFAHDDHIASLPHTYTAIWNDWFAESGRTPAEAPAIEHHNPTFDPRTGEGGVTIWIPIID